MTASCDDAVLIWSVSDIMVNMPKHKEASMLLIKLIISLRVTHETVIIAPLFGADSVLDTIFKAVQVFLYDF